MARVLAPNRNHSRQAASRSRIKGRTRSSPRFKGTTLDTHPSASIVTTPLVVGDKISTTGHFTTRLRLQDGTPKSVMGLLDESESGIVVWTFKPRAEDEACDFASEIISSSYAAPRSNMSIYGLTTSSAATNASLHDRRDEIDCDILSDPGGKLLRTMGYIDAKGQVKRGAFVIVKDGTLLMRKTGGTIFNVADGVFRVLKAVVKAKTVVGGVKVPY